MPAKCVTPPEDECGAGAMQDLHLRMKDWVTGVLGEVLVSHDSPASMTTTSRCINLFLMEFGSSLSTGSAKALPLQLAVRFVVTAWGSDVTQTNDDLCELGFSAMESPAFEVDLKALPAATWAAFGITPRPAFIIYCTVRKQRAHRPASMVRAPLVVVPSLMRSMEGTIVGPLNVPVASARVELLTLGLATLTDREGRFRFAGVPTDQALRFRVRARGLEQEFSPEISGDPGQRLQFCLDL